MSARRVHAVLAAGVENPRLIAHWQDEPQQLRRYGVEPASVDLSALWKFAGLTVKVRHNGLRADLPLTFRLLNVAGLEIELFASYASFRAAQGGRYAATTEGRVSDLLEFLGGWVDPSRPEHVLLWDLIRHEHALARLARTTVPVPAESDAPSRHARRLTGRSVLRVRGAILLHEMQSDPRSLGSILYQSNPQLDRVVLQRRRFCYWRPESAAEIRILELDEFGFSALSLIDGMGSAARLARTMGVGRGAGSVFLKLLGELVSAGVVDFGTGSGLKTA